MSSSPLDDYYALLGVHVGADGSELRRAWRTLAARFHPDRAGSEATAMFQRVSAAYEVLSDPLARAAYDRRRRNANPAAATKPPPAPPRASAPAVMLARLCGPLSALLATGAAELDDDDDGYITLILRRREAEQGGMATISMRVALWCPECAAKNQPSNGCARCGGTRTVEELFSAWLAVPPGVADGDVLIPSADLPGMVRPVRFRVRLPVTS